MYINHQSTKLTVLVTFSCLWWGLPENFASHLFCYRAQKQGKNSDKFFPQVETIRAISLCVKVNIVLAGMTTVVMNFLSKEVMVNPGKSDESQVYD